MARQGRPRERTVENIRSYWEGEAAELGDTAQVTIRDLFFRLHELQTLNGLLPEGCSLLDAGCGNGFGTLLLSRRTRRALGIDYAEGMVSWARRLLTDADHRRRVSTRDALLQPLPDVPPPGLEFQLGDVTRLDLGAERFEVVTTQRLLINLPTPEVRRLALARLRRHAVDGALLLASETTEQGYARTEAMRSRFGLPALERHWHNLYVDEDEFPAWADLGWRVDAVIGFETYLFLSKVVYPAACGTSDLRFLSASNAAALELASAFRTRQAAVEIGDDALLDLWSDRVAGRDAAEGAAVAAWLARHRRGLGDWSGVGHQRLMIARAV